MLPSSLPRNIKLSSSYFLPVPVCILIAQSSEKRICRSPSWSRCPLLLVTRCRMPMGGNLLRPHPITAYFQTLVLPVYFLHCQAPLPRTLAPSPPLRCYLQIIASAKVLKSSVCPNANIITVFLGFSMRLNELANEAMLCSVLKWEGFSLAFVLCLIWKLARYRVKIAIYIFPDISLSHGKSDRSPC